MSAVLHVMRLTSHVTRHTLQVTPHTSLLTLLFMYTRVKKAGKKAYVRLVTSLGMLNLELRCDV